MQTRVFSPGFEAKRLRSSYIQGMRLKLPQAYLDDTVRKLIEHNAEDGCLWGVAAESW